MNKTKAYLEIVHQIRQMITEDGLVPGDKLPSERELSERLNVGRSSVREGLRALELLGLIETKRGEGTFLRDFRDHHLVELLSTFILQDVKIKSDVLTTKTLIEKDAIQLLVNDHTHHSISLIKDKMEAGVYRVKDEFFYDIIEASNNRLLLKIWLIIKEFADQLLQTKGITDKEQYFNFIEAILKQNEINALNLYNKL